MNISKISKTLKAFIIGTAALELALLIFATPWIGQSLVSAAPDYADCYYPWLIFIWGVGIPCYIVLAFAWKIATNIGSGNAFSFDNARLFGYIYAVTITDIIIFDIINIAFIVMNMSHPGIFIISLGVSFAGIAFAVCAKVLAAMCENAAQLKEENELTI